MSDLDKIFDYSEKAEFIQHVERHLEGATKAVMVIITDTPTGYRSYTLTFGTPRMYEALGVLESGKDDLKKADISDQEPPDEEE